MRTILIALLVLCLTGCGSGNGNTSDNTSINADLLTLENYNQIKLDMSKEEVEALIEPGKIQDGSSSVYASYRWDWSNGIVSDAGTVTISFQNDAVTYMSQYGLP